MNNDKIWIHGIMTALLGIITLFFLSIYLYVGNRNGIFEPIETISLTLFFFGFVMTVFAAYILQKYVLEVISE